MRLLISFMVFLFFLPLSAQEAKKTEPVLTNLFNKFSQKELCNQWVDSVMNKLSLKEKVAQLFIYTIAPLETKQNLALLREAVDVHRVGGLLFSGGSMQQQVVLTNRAQRMAHVPLMITFDGEWGLAMRLKDTPSFPKNRVLGCIQDNSLIKAYGREMARQCKEMGVHVNFAPVADVNINPNNPVINNRSFGEIPLVVADKVVAYANGLEEGGVLAVCKHFPGHGDTDIDSHKALPVLPFSKERLDSIELFPFKKAIQAGVGGMMVGHLHVPAFDSKGGLPASLSPRVVQHLLKEKLQFNGLTFTDALAMKGVSGHGTVSLKALQAGNDMVLAPRHLKGEISSVIEAVERGELSQQVVEEKCRKVLRYKFLLGIAKQKPIQLSGLEQRLNREQTQKLIHQLYLSAVTVLKNKGQTLPWFAEPSRKIAVLEVGKSGKTTPFVERLSTYADVHRFQLKPNATAVEYQSLRDSLKKFSQVLVAVSEERLEPYRTFFAKNTSYASSVYVFFTSEKTFHPVKKSLQQSSAVIWAHIAEPYIQQRVADVLFAKSTANGRIPVTIPSLFKAGDGVTISPQSPIMFLPEDYGCSSIVLQRIDSIALDGIQKGVFPGCQVVVMKQGHLLVDKCFGTHAGQGSESVRSDDIYDLASLSKTTATLLAVMKLYDQGLFNLTDRIADYLPFLKDTDKKDITIQQLLYHQSGLPSFIPFYQEVIDHSSYSGRLFTARRDARHTVQLGSSTWANPQFSFIKEYVSSQKTPIHSLQISEHLWINPSFRTIMEAKIRETPLRSKIYRYSDIGFVLLAWMVEKITHQTLDDYLQREFYVPMGLVHTGYLPLRRFESSCIVPSSVDRFLRKTTLQGYVHDEMAAFQGGISGNAGLFSTAREVAQVYQMLLDGGMWQGKRYLSKETCHLFTTSVSKISRRGLGYDKPDVKQVDRSPCGSKAPAQVYGHTGFTGTCVWVDPINRIVYVFLSNRIYPNVTNRKMGQLEIREKIQDVIYESLITDKECRLQ